MEGTGLSTRRSGCSLVWLSEAGEGRASSLCLQRPGVGRTVMPNFSCLLPPLGLAVGYGATVARCGCDLLFSPLQDLVNPG